MIWNKTEQPQPGSFLATLALFALLCIAPPLCFLVAYYVWMICVHGLG